MDCFRSGLDGPELTGFDEDEDEDGLSEDPPKKSNPRSCFDGVLALGGGGRVPGESVVLGRTGGAGTSSPPIRSIFCGCGLLEAAGGG